LGAATDPFGETVGEPLRLVLGTEPGADMPGDAPAPAPTPAPELAPVAPAALAAVDVKRAMVRALATIRGRMFVSWFELHRKETSAPRGSFPTPRTAGVVVIDRVRSSLGRIRSVFVVAF